jgi:O-antigen/teichoic acid export membrane protein
VLEEIKKLLKHGSVYSLGNILNKAVGFLLIPFYTHYLTTADYGTLELLDLSVSLIGLLLNMWMNASLVRHYYEYEDSENRNEVVSTALIATATAAAVVSVFGLLWARGISHLILKSPEFFRLVQVIACNLFFTCVNSVSFSYLRARQRSSSIVAMNTVSLVVGLGLNIYLLAVMKTGVIGILLGSLISNILVTTVLTVLTVRQVGIHFDWTKFRALAAFGLPLIMTSFSAFELNFADRFFLQHYSNVSTVGVYALGYKFGYMLSFLLIQPFMMIWGARMYEVAKREDAGAVFSRIAGYFTLLMCAVALGMSLVIKEVISFIAPPQFHGAYKVVPLVALSYLFYGISYYFQSGVYISKKTHYLGLMGAICAVANIGLNFLLIPRFAAMGAAWATALSFFLMAVLAYVFSQRAYHIPYALSKVLVPLGAAVGTYCLAILIDVDSVAVSLMLKGFVLLGFGIVILLSGFFEKSETLSLRKAAGGMWGRFGWAGNASGRTIE